MKFLTIALIICTFLQSTIVSVDLVMLILLSRAYLTHDKTTLYLAFLFGLLVSLLSGTTLGVHSFIYLVVAEVARTASKIQVANSLIVLLPLMVVAIVFNHAISSYALNLSIQLWPLSAIETVVSIPVFFIVKIWEERFVVNKDIKLRI